MKSLLKVNKLGTVICQSLSYPLESSAKYIFKLQLHI